MKTKFISLFKRGKFYLKEANDLSLIRSSGLFDREWYLKIYPDVAKAKVDPMLHFLRNGGFEGRDPSPNFSIKWYLDTYPDVKSAGINPLVHYLRYGRKEGRIVQFSELDKLSLRIAESNQAAPPDHFYTQLNKDKIDLIDFAFTSLKVRSFADLGGVWGVDAGYTFYALDKYKLTSAVLVDTHPTDITKERSKNYPHLRFIQGNFSDKQIVRDVGQVDAVFLFDVLLHQVAPDWDQILEMYAPLTQSLIIFNQKWIGSNLTVRLLDLGEDEYFQNIPHNRLEKPYNELFQKLNQKHPDHDRVWKDVHHIWQWGITDADLLSKVEALGFRMQFYKNCGQFGNLKKFENHAYLFSK